MRRGFTSLLVIAPSLTYLAASNVSGAALVSLFTLLNIKRETSAALVTKQSFC